MIKKYMILLSFILLSTQLTAADKTHFTIAIDPEYIPFSQKDIEGNPTGLLVDFWDYWAEQNSYTVEYRFYPWEETIKATKEGKVDFHSGTTQDRDWMQASDEIYELHTTLFTLRNSKISSVKDIHHKRVGTIDSYYGELVSAVTGNGVSVKLYDDYPPMVEALKKGEIDALVDDVEAVVYYFIKTGQMHRFKQVHDKRLHFYNKIFAITNTKNSPLLEQINQGLNRLALEKLSEIEETWLPSVDNAFYTKKLKEHCRYTSNEEKWLTENKNISLTGDPLWSSALLENGGYHYIGIVGDYIRIITASLGNEFTANPIESWQKILDLNIKSDIVFGSMNQKIKDKLSQNYDFLEPHDFGPMVIVMNKSVRFVTSLYDIQTKKIGILSSQEYTKRIMSKYIDYDFEKIQTVPSLLDAIKSGKIDAGLLSLSKAINFLVDDKYDTLDIVGKTEESIYIDIGVLRQKPMLKSILKKSLLSLDPNHREKILSKWTRRLNYIEKIDYKLTYSIASLLGLLLLSTGYYAYAIRKKHVAVQRMNVKIEYLARVDDLTGLYNKRAFNQAFEKNDSEKQISGLLFVDIDYFKKYNDFYGHLQGDDALSRVGEQLNNYNSHKCSAYRIGGEEFGIIMYGYSEKNILELAEKLRLDIEALEIDHLQSPFGHITVSVGVAIAKKGWDTRSLYQNADKALYKAKILGRNSIFLYDDEERIT